MGSDRELLTQPSKVAGGISRVVAEGGRAFVETWLTSEGDWVRSEMPISSVLKAPPARQKVLLRFGVPEAFPDYVPFPLDRVVVPPVVVDGELYRLGSTSGRTCFVELWVPARKSWKRLHPVEFPNCAAVIDAPRASRAQLQKLGVIGAV